MSLSPKTGDLIAKALDYANPWWGKLKNNRYIYG